jgi:hypothetical protein
MPVFQMLNILDWVLAQIAPSVFVAVHQEFDMIRQAPVVDVPSSPRLVEAYRRNLNVGKEIRLQLFYHKDVIILRDMSV